MNADGSTHFSIDSFRKLSKFESFIREVMRTKGDTIAAVRYTTNDVQVGKFLLLMPLKASESASVRAVF
ncbi:hypothetical protein ACEPPN_005971 [Leptodophora sp. 'Broadleaf-Isolate-01']